MNNDPAHNQSAENSTDGGREDAELIAVLEEAMSSPTVSRQRRP